MSSSRKDDHIKFAKESIVTFNDFDNIRFTHRSIPNFRLSDIDLTTTILGKSFPYPFYINAMTGGNREGNSINLKLAALANHFNLPFFIGSQSLAFKDERVGAEYVKLREEFPNLFIVGNINPNFTPEMAKKAISLIRADAIAIHVNSVQELVMGEGDRDFSEWENNIKKIIKAVNVPVIVKEVGYGMNEATLQQLKDLGVKTIDISGAGGTNFTDIELGRQGKSSSPLQDFGISTVDSLLKAKSFSALTIHASGGINNAGSIVKALALGANAVGMARYFLKLSELPFEEMIETVNELIEDIKKILLLLNVRVIKDLNINHLIFNN